MKDQEISGACSTFMTRCVSELSISSWLLAATSCRLTSHGTGRRRTWFFSTGHTKAVSSMYAQSRRMRPVNLFGSTRGVTPWASLTVKGSRKRRTMSRMLKTPAKSLSPAMGVNRPFWSKLRKTLSPLESMHRRTVSFTTGIFANLP